MNGVFKMFRPEAVITNETTGLILLRPFNYSKYNTIITLIQLNNITRKLIPCPRYVMRWLTHQEFIKTG